MEVTYLCSPWMTGSSHHPRRERFDDITGRGPRGGPSWGIPAAKWVLILPWWGCQFNLSGCIAPGDGPTAGELDPTCAVMLGLARIYYRSVLPRMHFIPDSLTYSVPL